MSSSQTLRKLLPRIAISAILLVSTATSPSAQAQPPSPLPPQSTEMNRTNQLAQKAVQRNDYATTYKLYTNNATKGDAFAQNELGQLYYQGKGVERDYEQARIWFEKAAAQNNVSGQSALGRLCRTLRRDRPARTRLYRRRTARNPAQPRLGALPGAPRTLGLGAARPRLRQPL